MDILIFLQFVTIAISLFSMIFGYVIAARERGKDNKTEIFSKKLLSNVRVLRENIAVILAMANPSTIREQVMFKNLKDSFKGFTLLDEVEKAIDKIKAIFFPFYPQENHMLATLDSLKESIKTYSEDIKNEKNEAILRNKIRQVYMEYAVYDKAMSDAINEQTTQSNYTFYTFDQYYDKISSEHNFKVMKNKVRGFTRYGQGQTVDEKEVENLMQHQNETKELL